MSNIYLNELDRFVAYNIRPLAYLRYGDDWLCFVRNKDEALEIQQRVTTFLLEKLNLVVNSKVNFIRPVWKGVDYLGVSIWPLGHSLQKGVRVRSFKRLNETNVASYRSLTAANDKPRRLKELDWYVINLLESNQ